MANKEQLHLFEKGVEAWNDWRARNRSVNVDLSKTDFSGWDRSGANLYESNLQGTNFKSASLSGADLAGANLQEADLSEANLRIADLSGANLCDASLIAADLYEANLRQAVLARTKLNHGDLNRTDFSESDLTDSDFSKAIIGDTIFGKCNLNQAINLDKVIHQGPSRISTDTLALSEGRIPEIFLRGCGLSDWEIEMVKLYDPGLSNNQFIDIENKIFDLRQRQALQISPLFISYSHRDRTFVDKIGNYLTGKGIRFWRDIHDMKAGRIEKQIDRAIRQNQTVLLILSTYSLNSDWVEYEVRTARGVEKEMERDVLCPVALDDSWKDSRWPKRLMEQITEYNILDFSGWEDDSKFDSMFRKLIDGLELFYKGSITLECSGLSRP